MKSDFTHLSQAWQACLAQFLMSLENRSGSVRSRQAYEYNLAVFFAERSPEQATRADVLTFIHAPSRHRDTLGNPVVAGTVNNRLTALSSFYKFAAGYDLPGGEPLLKTKPPTLGVKFLQPGSRYRGMSLEELQRLFAVIPDTPRGRRDRALYTCLWWTGRRRSELLRVKVKDITPATFVEKNGSTRPGWLYSCVVKGHSRERYRAELPLPAYEALREYWAANGRDPGPEDFLFTNVKHSMGHLHYDEALDPNWPAISFKSYCEAAGLDTDRLTLHSLRRSAARTRFEQHPDLEELRVFLGHSSLATTQKYILSVTGQADPAALRLQTKFAHLGKANSST